MIELNLKANPSTIDNAVFLADKLSWKETENQILINKMRIELKESIERTAFCYLKNLYDKREKLPLYHEWSNDAYRHFSNICGVHTIIYHKISKTYLGGGEWEHIYGLN